MNGEGRPRRTAPHDTDSLDEAATIVQQGRRLDLDYRPDVAAIDLAVACGGRVRAHMWALALVEATR